MFPASMRDILNHVQTMELDEDVAILDGTFDIGIDQIRSITKNQPTPGYITWMNNSVILFRRQLHQELLKSDESERIRLDQNEMVSEYYTR
ncbi:hypothetical protein Tco_0680856 [Tanacetum coccineum]|uniref:Uncharacterized protein n=1 Tax=Tanacetum coccineum TaxID=301880 RepID=A0ABQ4XMK2_9ASTR